MGGGWWLLLLVGGGGRPSLAIEAMECLYSLFCRLPDVVELVPMATIHEESKHTGATPPPANEAEARARTRSPPPHPLFFPVSCGSWASC